jgi:spermidine synthase
MPSKKTSLISKQAVLHTVAFVVSLCSFAYELVYSELLTVMYGGALTQYGLTIGLFFSSLGLGSYLSAHLDDDRDGNFFRAEVYLAFSAPVGVLFIILLNTVEIPAAVPDGAVQTLARLPVVVVGALSGFELPLLLSMVKSEYGDRKGLRGWRKTAADYVNEVAYRFARMFFHTSRSGNEYSAYSTVLAMDYLGGLGGALVYVFVLYPEVGLIPSVFLLALLNCFVALVFVARFSSQPWGVFGGGGEKRNIVTQEHTVLFVACLVLTVAYAGVGLQSQQVDSEVSEYYLEDVIEENWPEGTIEANVTDQTTTRYQRIVEYNRTWVGESENTRFAGSTDTCMRLDEAIQFCESWIDSYHSGLVDVPMTMYPNSAETDVLLIGGGDYVAVDNLRSHGVNVDQVDIDGEFLERAKSDSFLRQYHDDAYTYENLSVYQQDAYAYLQSTDRKYDLILLDLPGAKTDEMLNLYSVSFYSMLRSHLTERGVVVTWGYSKYTFGDHYKAYMNTVSEAGFRYKSGYWAYEDLNQNGETQLGERFYMLAPDEDRPTVTPEAGTKYVRRYSDRYRQHEWQPTPTYEDVQTNRVFHPNYDILVETRFVDDGNGG